MLHPRLTDKAVFAELQAQWRATKNIRIDPFLADEVVRELRDAFREQVFELTSEPGWSLSYQYFRYGFQPESDCDHAICRFGRWLETEGVAFIRRLTERDVIVDPTNSLQTTLYGKGCFLEAHNDYDGYRKITYVIGLTEDRWDSGIGGHLEMLVGGEVACRPPGFGSVDLFDVSTEEVAPTHRIPLVTQPLERRVVVGWLVSPEDAQARQNGCPPTT